MAPHVSRAIFVSTLLIMSFNRADSITIAGTEKYVMPCHDNACSYPKKLRLNISQLDYLSLDHLQSLPPVWVSVANSSKTGHDEYQQQGGIEYKDVILRDFVKDLRHGSTGKWYLKLEDADPDKHGLEAEGKTIRHNLGSALKSAGVISASGLCPTNRLDLCSSDPKLYSDWAMWLGGPGTTTSMHADPDVFNFLYVVFGKKRVVFAPRSTDGSECKATYRGVCWTGIDILSNRSSRDGLHEVILNPGEGINLSSTMHAVENLEVSLSVSFRMDTPYDSSEIKKLPEGYYQPNRGHGEEL